MHGCGPEMNGVRGQGRNTGFGSGSLTMSVQARKEQGPQQEAVKKIKEFAAHSLMTEQAPPHPYPLSALHGNTHLTQPALHQGGAQPLCSLFHRCLPAMGIMWFGCFVSFSFRYHVAQAEATAIFSGGCDHFWGASELPGPTSHHAVIGRVATVYATDCVRQTNRDDFRRRRLAEVQG